MKSGFGLASLAKKFVPFGSGRQFFGLCSETLGFLIETFWESQNVFETTTLHDTPLGFRVLTVGFQSSDPNYAEIARSVQL
ncbi:hypothetical protein UP10_01340 [Bradyrhizobium sp. LTSPM299]|uniref:hypothetical protein n=1 Tax=Bradyrhizobium sp. LTSPM299 TaxID=1619233 RepID=UPI0005C97352|nr:hypothetical protein UP10_01340 [Bradyrhizobium sp. LTSPM299]